MNAIDQQKRKDAIKGLINIAILEGFVLVAVIAVYFYTNSATLLIGGVLGSTLLFGPLFLRWARAHGAAVMPKPNSKPKSSGDADG